MVNLVKAVETSARFYCSRTSRYRSISRFKPFYLLILIGFLFGCVHQPPKVPPQMIASSYKSTTQYRQVASFSQIDVKGRVNVTLHTGYKKPQVILTGDPRDLAQVQTAVTQNTLYMVLGNGYPRYGAVHADIRGNVLTRFHYEGQGKITGNRLHTRSLDLYLANSGTTKLAGTIGLRTLDVRGGTVQISGITSYGLQVHLTEHSKVQLTGIVNSRKLDLDGTGWLSMYWIKSDNLTVRARNGVKIQLAGITNRLDVELWGNAQFKGSHLRALRSFVKTHGKSVAEISSVNHQSSLATDASDIYYYNLPDTRADFMAFDGSVLDMRDLSDYDVKDFTRYNKQFP